MLKDGRKMRNCVTSKFIRKSKTDAELPGKPKKKKKKTSINWSDAGKTNPQGKKKINPIEKNPSILSI